MLLIFLHSRWYDYIIYSIINIHKCLFLVWKESHVVDQFWTPASEDEISEIELSSQILKGSIMFKMYDVQDTARQVWLEKKPLVLMGSCLFVCFVDLLSPHPKQHIF